MRLKELECIFFSVIAEAELLHLQALVEVHLLCYKSEYLKIY